MNQITLKRFKELYPDYSTFKVNVVDKIVALKIGAGNDGGAAVPTYMDDAKMFYKYETLYLMLYNRYSSFVAVNPDDIQHGLMQNALLNVLPKIHGDTLGNRNASLAKLDIDTLFSTIDKRYNEDPDNNYASTETGYTSTPSGADGNMHNFDIKKTKDKNLVNRKDATVRIREVTNLIDKYGKLGDIDLGAYVHDICNSFPFASIWEMLDVDDMRVVEIKGDKGEKGEKGDKGDKGDVGSVNNGTEIYNGIVTAVPKTLHMLFDSIRGDFTVPNADINRPLYPKMAVNIKTLNKLSKPMEKDISTIKDTANGGAGHANFKLRGVSVPIYSRITDGGDKNLTLRVANQYTSAEIQLNWDSKGDKKGVANYVTARSSSPSNLKVYFDNNGAVWIYVQHNKAFVTNINTDVDVKVFETKTTKPSGLTEFEKIDSIQNTKDIKTNASHIEDNSKDITINEKDISTNEDGIADNKKAIDDIPLNRAKAYDLIGKIKTKGDQITIPRKEFDKTSVKYVVALVKKDGGECYDQLQFIFQKIGTTASMWDGVLGEWDKIQGTSQYAKIGHCNWIAIDADDGNDPYVKADDLSSSFELWLYRECI